MENNNNITTEIGHIVFPESGEKIDFVLLKISKSQILLEFPTDSLRASSTKRYDIIIGVFNGIGNVTLIECTYAGSQLGGAKYVLKLEANYLLKGIHISRFHDLKFSKAIISYSTLFNWINSRIISFNSSDESPINIKYPEDIIIGDLDDFKLSITHFLRQQMGGKNIQYSQDTCLKIDTQNEELSLWDLLDAINEFKKFLMIFTNSYPKIEWINLYSEKHTTKKVKGKKTKKLGINLQIPNRYPQDSFLPYSPSLEFKDVKENMGSIVGTWFTNRDLAISANLILEKSFNLGLSRENFFLNSCFAIENYHRLFRIEKKMNFQDRLLNLKDDFTRAIPEGKNVADYVKIVVDTRNHFVHRSPKKKIFSGIDLYYAASYLETIVKLNIFKELKVSEEIIDREFLKSQKMLAELYELNKRRQSRSSD